MERPHARNDARGHAVTGMEPLAPMTMPGGDVVCPHCDAGGNPLFCEWHRPESGPIRGLAQIVPSTWGQS